MEGLGIRLMWAVMVAGGGVAVQIPGQDPLQMLQLEGEREMFFPLQSRRKTRLRSMIAVGGAAVRPSFPESRPPPRPHCLSWSPSETKSQRTSDQKG